MSRIKSSVILERRPMMKTKLILALAATLALAACNVPLVPFI
ncbi:MAG: hypothetical protein Q4G24_07970 [Paracoccus sp. (in: a-proteobacteria)]|nr:hypothetical protein [Paracoccus sp. (in: a-proteobacteria)]MDO5621390.1 hypothetical protein [Paracoccus sp. (in: a-proteobacteria)]